LFLKTLFLLAALLVVACDSGNSGSCFLRQLGFGFPLRHRELHGTLLLKHTHLPILQLPLMHPHALKP